MADAQDVAGKADTADVDAQQLIAWVADKGRGWVISHGDSEASDGLRQRCLAAIPLLNNGAPLAYATGKAHFRHLTLQVDERVLIPRPETEILVDIVLEMSRNLSPATSVDKTAWTMDQTTSTFDRTALAIDIGTGSGAIALSLAIEGEFSRIVATDISLDALAVARGNYDSLRACSEKPPATVEFRHGSLFAPLESEPELLGNVDVIVSNPPYIAFEEAESLPSNVRDWEPSVALFSPNHGMEAIEEIISEAPRYLSRGGLLALEVDSSRASLTAQVMEKDGRYQDVAVRLDLTRRERFVVARRI